MDLYLSHGGVKILLMAANSSAAKNDLGNLSYPAHFTDKGSSNIMENWNFLMSYIPVEPLTHFVDMDGYGEWTL